MSAATPMTDFVPRAAGPKGMRRPRPVEEAARADWSAERDMEVVAERAQRLVSDIRSHDPAELLRAVAVAAVTEPVRVAQIVLALAAWVPDDEPLSARLGRVQAIAEGRPA